MIWLISAGLVGLAAAGGAAWYFLAGGATRKPQALDKTQVWYGRVNTWPFSEKNLDKDVKEMAASGVKGYMIELMGWARSDAWTDKWLKDTEKKYEYLLKLCRKHGLWLFVSVVNDNMGSRKYGDPGVFLASVMDKAKQLAQIVKKNGSDNVIVQPVAETQTSAGRQFEQYCVQQLGGFPLVYNGGSRPNGIPGGFKYRAWHPFKVADKCPADAIVVSDTGMIIVQLGHGLDGAAKPDTLEKWARDMRKSGVKITGYYAFKFDGHDKEAIKALGRSLKG